MNQDKGSGDAAFFNAEEHLCAQRMLRQLAETQLQAQSCNSPDDGVQNQPDENTYSEQFSAGEQQESLEQLGSVAQCSAACCPSEVLNASKKMQRELQLHQIELEMQNDELRRTYMMLADLHDQYYDLFNMAPVGYCTLDEAGQILQANVNAVNLLAGVGNSLVHKPIYPYIVNEDQDIFYHHRKQLISTRKQLTCELRIRRGGNDLADRMPGMALVGGGTVELLNQVQSADALCWVRLSSVVRCESDGSVVFRIAINDITEQKRIEDELRIADVAFASQNGMVITDPRGRILRINPAFTQLTGYSATEAVGQSMSILKSGRHAPQFYHVMWTTIREQGHWQGEIWNKRKNGQVYAEMLSITAIATSTPGVMNYVASYTDIMANKEVEAEIRRLAYYDLLTGLPNRRLLQDRISQALAATKRSNQLGALFLIDLDNFKNLNDSRGHEVGDLLLVEVAQRLRVSVREADTVARQGGDEFVVLLENLGDDTNHAVALAHLLGQKLREVIARPFILNGFEYHCKLCIGVSLFGEQDLADNIFKHADLALYQAKNAGRNTLQFFDPAMQAALDSRKKMEADLRKALGVRQLELYYQPQVNAQRRVVGVEAILHWRHPIRGLIQADDIFPLAEETGLILSIGVWMLEIACAQLRMWANDDLTSALYIVLNITPRQFRQPDFVSQVSRILEDSGANPALLRFELTEHVVLANVDETIKKMHELNQIGIQFSLDDFGLGYSSLSYLARLPMKQIRIHRTFVGKLPGHQSDETIVRALITMGRGLNLHVIAEGVCTKEQHAFLEMHGCNYYQGNLYGLAVPLENVEIRIRQSNNRE